MSDLGLNSNDFQAIARAMDQNKNNRIDPSEATISFTAQNKIGNSNGIAGTKELSDALSKGEVFIGNLKPEIVDRVADYFSKRPANAGKMPEQWQNDGWISREDLTMNDNLRARIDVNADNKVSKKEFSDAIMKGVIQFGASAPAPTTSGDPFGSKPATNTKPNTTSGDPFSSGTKPNTSTSDPFGSKPNNATSDPFSGNKPVSEVDSGAYIQLEASKHLSFDSDKVKVINDVAGKFNLSTREQNLVVDYTKTLSYDSNKVSALTTLAKNKGLTEGGAIYLAKNLSTLSYDSSKKTVLNSMIENKQLSPAAQQWVAFAAMNMSYDSDKVAVLTNLISRQPLDMKTKEYILTEANKNLSYDSSKKAIYSKLFN